ncbi:MAG: hypothetical protein EXX96DRAFT_556544, partial [Benjaminiella poitrasii]
MEKARRLVIFAFANAKFVDQDMKNLATKALHLPASLEHLEQEDDSGKVLAFSPETVEKVHNARFNQAILKGAAEGHFSKGHYQFREGPSSYRNNTQSNFRQLNGSSSFF